MTTKTESSTVFIDSFDNEAAKFCGDALFNLIGGPGDARPLVFLCIGTDRATGDAFGPLVGSGLANLGIEPVYGNLDEPLHAVNLTAKLTSIHARHKNPLIVAVDACLGKARKKGEVIVKQGAISPGLAKGDEIARVGDVSIMGVISNGALSAAKPLAALASARLGLVMRMAWVVIEGINRYLEIKV